MKKLAIAAVLAFAAYSAAPSANAQECTEETAQSLAEEIYAMVEEKGMTEQELQVYVDEVEAHYGGPPSDEQACEALGMLKEKVAGS